MPNREHWKDMLPIVQAFAEGKQLEIQGCDNKWMDLTSDPDFTSRHYRYRIKPQPTAADYVAAQAECGLKVGDWVRITRPAEEGEQGWQACWPTAMDALVGNTGKIIGYADACGFKVRVPDEPWHSFPYFVLEKTDPPYRPFKDGEEFLTVLARQSLPMLRDSEGDCLIVAGIVVPRGVCIDAMVYTFATLLKNYKFLDGRPCGVPMEV